MSETTEHSDLERTRALLSSRLVHATLQAQDGRWAEAESLCGLLSAAQPQHARGLQRLGVMAFSAGRAQLARTLLVKAIALNAGVAAYHVDLGALAMHLNRVDEAIASYQKALALEPGNAAALANLGSAQSVQGRSDDAMAQFERALLIKPDFAEALNNLGTLLKDRGRLAEARARYEQACVARPDFAEALSNLGTVFKAQGRLQAAAGCYDKALAARPDIAETWCNLGNVLTQQGRAGAATSCYARALVLRPHHAQALTALAALLQDSGRLDEAIACYESALVAQPGSAEVLFNLGNALQAQDRFGAARRRYEQALALRPDYAKALCNFGNLLKVQGLPQQALTCYARALAIQADYAEAWHNLLFLHAYGGVLSAENTLALARGWERACVAPEDREAAAAKRFSRPPLAGRKLRIGYVSGDFCQHAVGYFIKQVFACHDRTRVTLTAYATAEIHDAARDEFMALADHWVPLSGLSDAAAAARIGADGIDVLIDLSGHTAHNRLGVFALRAAPVQAHYLGYFASTGLSQMDYWIGDEVLTPAADDAHFAERVWRLPRVWVSYQGSARAPVSDWHPDVHGRIWLGSYNNLNKLTPETLALWAQVLQALPEGCLLLKTRELADSENRQRILDALAALGVEASRIELQDRRVTPDWASHMGYYDRLDIALDPVGGVGGGTTTSDALWMAVPVVTLRGDRMASRMTASMLAALGQADWIAEDTAEYVRKVVALARDVALRRRLRASQRQRMAHSPLGDARGLTRELEQAYVEMFERWHGNTETETEQNANQ